MAAQVLVPVGRIDMWDATASDPGYDTPQTEHDPWGPNSVDLHTAVWWATKGMSQEIADSYYAGAVVDSVVEQTIRYMAAINWAKEELTYATRYLEDILNYEKQMILEKNRLYSQLQQTMPDAMAGWEQDRYGNGVDDAKAHLADARSWLDDTQPGYVQAATDNVAHWEKELARRQFEVEMRDDWVRQMAETDRVAYWASVEYVKKIWQDEDDKMERMRDDISLAYADKWEAERLLENAKWTLDDWQA